MGLVFNPYNGTWQQIYHQLLQATQLGPKTYLPIPKFILPTQISKRVIVAGASSQSAKGNWRYAGRLIPIVDCGAVDFGQAELRGLGVPLNKGQIFILPQFASTYQLRFEPFYWMEDILLSVWEFDGDVSDSTENLILSLQAN
jgi:hypothetical protein